MRSVYSLHMLRLALFLVLGTLFWAPSAHSSDEAFTADQERLYKKGHAAVEQKSWEKAIEYFTELQRSAPTHSDLLFNLGLAHAEAGHDLAALAWYEAFVANHPADPNRAVADDEIIRLEVSVETQIDVLFEQAVAAADALPAGETSAARIAKVVAYQKVMEAAATAGHFKHLDQLIEGMAQQGEQSEQRARAFETFGTILVEEGDLDGAKDLLRRMQRGEARHALGAAIAARLVADGQVAQAEAMADSLPQGESRDDANASLVAAYVDSGRLDDAQRKTTEIDDRISSARAHGRLGLAQVERGDLDAARTHAEAVKSRIVDVDDWLWRDEGTTKLLLALGDFAPLEKHALETKTNPTFLYRDLIDAYLAQGKVREAERVLGQIDPDDFNRLGAVYAIAQWYIREKDDPRRALALALDTPWATSRWPEMEECVALVAGSYVRDGKEKRAFELAKTFDNGEFVGQVYAARIRAEIAVELTRRGQPVEAILDEMLLGKGYWAEWAIREVILARIERGEFSSATVLLDTHWDRQRPNHLKIVDALLDAGQDELAGPILAKRVSLVLDSSNSHTLAETADRCERIGATEAVQQLRERIVGLENPSASDLLLQLASKKTYDVQARLDKAKTESALAQPYALARIAQVLSTRLRKLKGATGH